MVSTRPAIGLALCLLALGACQNSSPANSNADGYRASHQHLHAPAHPGGRDHPTTHNLDTHSHRNSVRNPNRDGDAISNRDRSASHQHTAANRHGDDGTPSHSHRDQSASGSNPGPPLAHTNPNHPPTRVADPNLYTTTGRRRQRTPQPVIRTGAL